MNALDRAIEHLMHVRTNLRLAWIKADDAVRPAIEADEHRISLALQILTEQQQKERLRREGRFNHRRQA